MSQASVTDSTPLPGCFDLLSSSPFSPHTREAVQPDKQQHPLDTASALHTGALQQPSSSFCALVVDICPPAGATLHLALPTRPKNKIPDTLVAAPRLQGEYPATVYRSFLATLKASAISGLEGMETGGADWVRFNHREALHQMAGDLTGRDKEALALCWETWGGEAASGDAVAWALVAQAATAAPSTTTTGDPGTSETREAVWEAALRLSHRGAEGKALFAADLGQVATMQCVMSVFVLGASLWRIH